MMISSLDIYLISLLDGLQGFLCFFLIICIVFLILRFIAFTAEWGEREYCYIHEETEGVTCRRKFVDKFIAPSAICLIFTALLLVFIPDSETAAAIYIIPKVANSDVAKNLPPKLIELTDAYIKNLGKGGKND